MTLTTHALVGAAAASIFPSQPVLACAAAFCSHFVIDSLPHWDYSLLSKHNIEENRLQDDIDVHDKKFFVDVLRVGSDVALGTLLSVGIFSFWLFDLPIWLVVLGAWAGILPDPLQFVYYKTRSKILEPLQRFHIWIQKGKSIYPPPFVGILYQFILVVTVLLLLNLF